MRFALVFVLVIGLIPSVALGQVRRKSEKGTAPKTVEKGTARGADQPRGPVNDPEWLRTRLEKVRRRYDLPDLGAAIVLKDKVVAASVVGVRKYGTQIAAQRNDPFHLGSITKVMSATLIGMLIEDGILRWDMTMEGSVLARARRFSQFRPIGR
jgi:CubicO group peptidase (beta-lactamase class C family)